MISFRQKGNFTKLTAFLQKKKEISKLSFLDKYGLEGVEALKNATPVDTGLTANSWSYKITRGKNMVSISFHNSNRNDGVPIAIVLNYGHATRGGGWVEGKNYIMPAIQPIFDKILLEAQNEVNKR